MNDYSPELIEKAKNVKVLVLDVDGVLTDGKLTYSGRRIELKDFDVNDGFGIFRAKRAGIKCVILTANGSSLTIPKAQV